MNEPPPVDSDRLGDLTEIDAEQKSRLLQVVLNAIDQGFVVWDDDECMIVCNDRFRELWNYPASLAKPGVSAIELLRYDARQGEHGNGEEDTVATQRNNKARAHHADGTDEVYITKTGQILYIRRYSIEGLGSVSTFTDVSDLRHAEDALNEKSYLLEATLNAIDQAVAIWDSEDNLVISNHQFADLWGYPDTLTKPGTPSLEFVRHVALQGGYGPGDPEKLARSYLKQARSHHRDLQDEQFTTVDDRTLLIRRYSTAQFGSVSTFIDISELKENETRLEAQKTDLETARAELEHLNHQKDKFFSLVSHDLRGPLNAFLGYSGLISDQIDTMEKENLREYASIIHESGTRLSRLLENLLEWSRVQMGGIEFSPEQVDLKALIDTNISLFLPQAEQKEISLQSTTRHPVLLTADANMLDTVVRNLISNAIKFTSVQGSVVVSTQSASDDVHFTVKDTGVGMTADKVEKLFLLEEHMSTTGTSGETGTGLGLQFCKEYVEKHGGRIRVESNEGMGSVFTVSLPAGNLADA
jgi:signal transduction histidine kinase